MIFNVSYLYASSINDKSQDMENNKSVTFLKPLFILLILLISIFLTSCDDSIAVDTSKIELVDPQATVETKLFYSKLKYIKDKGIAIGHQDPTAYGIGWKASEKNSYRSDLHDVTGKFPAVQGWDVGHIELGKSQNLDSVPFDLMRKHIIEGHSRGAIITLSWHLDNPVTGGPSWDSIPAIKTILKGGANRDKYGVWVDKFADFVKTLKDKKGEPIPILFRPYHEMNGHWFWWGKESCTPEEYKMLFRDLVDLLQKRDIHNLLYCYSTNSVESFEEYQTYYPGDEYVDILGIDLYNHQGDDVFTEYLKKNLGIVNKFAKLHDKPFAMTESGNNKPKNNATWWTEFLYPGIKDSGIIYALFWRNSRESHYFTTYPNDVSSEDFKKFEQTKDILFLDDIKGYHFKDSSN